jgi:FAD/FMN-containing dehydrogenase
MPLPHEARLSRRRFLVGSSQAALAASLGGLLPDMAEARAPSVSDRAWRELSQRLSGRLLRAQDAGYAELIVPMNLRYAAIRPAGIARCETAAEVAQAIRWSRENRMPLVARSGGHSYAGYSTTTGLVIDLSLMKAVQFDKATRILRIGGGARGADVHSALREPNMTLTHGRCAGVGAAGFVLGGGVGFNMRQYGLGCDQVVASEIVTADGEIRPLSATENVDLFWACRGAGGGNFGIHTSFSLQTFPAEPITVFAITWSTKPEAVLAALMPALDAAPDRLGCRISLSAVTPKQLSEGTDVTVDLLGQFQGNSKELLDILDPAYRVAPPARDEIVEKKYWDAQDILIETNEPGYFQERSTFIAGALDARALGVAFDRLRRWPGTSGDGDLRFIQTGGKVNTVAADATAFVHRSSRWLMVVGLFWTAKDRAAMVRRAREWQDAFYSAMLPFGLGGAYQNFVDPSLTDWPRAYYGDNLPRLGRIKAAVDPGNVFQFAQSIRPAAR